MYLDTYVLWTVYINCALLISEVHSERFTSPRFLFSEEPSILDDYYIASQKENSRSTRSTDEESSHERIRRDIPNPVPAPEIPPSKPLCDHSRLFMKWTDTNEVYETGPIIALCREDDSDKSNTKRKTHDVFISYDHGKNWVNKTQDFISANKDVVPTIDMYYTTPANPKFVVFVDKINKVLFWSINGGKAIFPAKLAFVPDLISINPSNSNIIIASDSTSRAKQKETWVYFSKDGGQTFKKLPDFNNVKAFYWGSEANGDKSTDLFIEAEKTKGVSGIQGWKLECGASTKTCGHHPTPLTTAAPINGTVVDFLVKGPYMFVTQENKDKTAVVLFVKYKRTGTFKKATIVTKGPLKEFFVYDVSGGHVMLVVNHRKNETNLYNSLDVTGSRYSISLPRVLYHNPNTEVSSNWLRNAVKYRFVDVRRVQGLPSVYFATQLTAGPVGGRYLISKMTFDKGGVWQKINGPTKKKFGSPCIYPACSLHLNLLYGSIYRYSKTTPLMSRKSAPGLLMATGVLGSNLKITPDTYLSRNGGYSFKQVLRGKRRFGFGDYGGFVLASDFSMTRFIQYSVDFENFYHTRLSESSNVDIKMILTEPGEKGLIFLVIGTVNGVYHVYHVNATRSLGLPCTKKDFYTINVTDVGVGGCAIKQIELRNSSSRCVSGRNHSTVTSISYEKCMCRRNHYQCGVQFIPENTECRKIPGTSLVPKHCPEGEFFNQSRGYEKIPEYATCTEDSHTKEMWSSVRTPCPVEKLVIKEIKTSKEVKNAVIHMGLHEILNVSVALINGYLPGINFKYTFGNYSQSRLGQSSISLKMNKTGSIVLNILVENSKSSVARDISVYVIRKLAKSMLTVSSYPNEPSIKENVVITSVLTPPGGIHLGDYGFPLFYKWKIESFNPSQKIIHQSVTPSPVLKYVFQKTGHHQVNVTVVNDISSISSVADISVTIDLKPKNVQLSNRVPDILKVTWDEILEPNILRYRVSYRRENDQDFVSADCKPKRDDPNCDILNVQYYTKYFVKVNVVLKDGFGPDSDTVNMITSSGPPGAPEKVKLVNEGTLGLEASWQPPKFPNGKVVGYMYKFYKASENPPSAGVFIPDPKKLKKTFDNLVPNEAYAFEIAAKNVKVVGIYSETKFASTGFDKPTFPPTEIATTSLATTTATLRWTAPILKKGSKAFFSPKNYKIYMKQSNGSYKEFATAPDNQYTFTKLQPFTKYDVQISAESTAGEGPRALFSFKTLMKAPNAPADLKTTSVSSTEATFTWSPLANIKFYSLYQLSPDTSRKPWIFTTPSGKVSSLSPYTNYVFAVTATNKHNESEQSIPFKFRTDEGIPEKPDDVDVTLVWPLSSSMNISWIPPLRPNGVIIKYTVKWFVENFLNMEQQDVSGDTRWVVVNHLAQRTSYGITVEAYTRKGKGQAHAELKPTDYYPYGSQPITIPFEGDKDASHLSEKKNFKKVFIETVAGIANINKIRIANVRLDLTNNTVKFELISKEDLHHSASNDIQAEMDKVMAKLQPSFEVLGAKTKANELKSGKPYSGPVAGQSSASKGGSNMALIVGLVCAAVIIALILVIAMMFVRYRRKSLYNKFDNQVQYNHDDDSPVRYEESPEIEMAPATQKRRHKDIETVPLADADELT